MKHLICFFLILTSLGSIAQDKLALSEKAFQLDNKLTYEHVLGPVSPDSIGARYTKILLRFLDRSKIIFTQADVDKLMLLGKHIHADFAQRKSRYYSEISSLFQKRLTELEAEQKKLKDVPLNLSWNISLTEKEKNTFPDEAGRLLKLKKYFYLSCYDDLIEHEHNPLKLGKDSLTFYEQETRKRISTSKMEFYHLLKTDNSILDEYYLLAYSLAHDPHSMYMSPSTKNDFLAPLDAEKERFGFSYSLNDANEVVIQRIEPGSPVWLNGEIQTNDVLVAVGTYENKKLKMLQVAPGLIGLRELAKVLDQYTGKELILVVRDKKNNQEIQVELTKALVYNDDDIVKNALYRGDNKIGYVYLPDFYSGNLADGTEKGCASDIAKCILKLKKDSIQGLILDLRGNGGGALYEAIALVGIFIDYGPVGAEIAKGGEIHVFKDINRGLIYDGPLMILVDESSASASEIVAGALQDYNKALIVGSQSFGKATTQQVYPVDPLGSMNNFMDSYNPEYGFSTITQSVLYRITGESNQKRGVIPDIQIGTPLDRSKLEVESNEIGALDPPVLAKKMVFTKAYPSIPIEALKTHDRLLREDPRLNRSYAMVDSLMESNNGEESLDFKTYFTATEKYNKLYDQFEEELKRLNWSGTLSSNTFDQELYLKNPVLNGFYNDFIEELKTDFELNEAFGLMEKWLSLINK